MKSALEERAQGFPVLIVGEVLEDFGKSFPASY